ncbi:MAG: non-canonical purine NTP pyrophosphatase [Parachlamydiales bacterium]
MKGIIFGTTNEAKIKQVRGALASAKISVEGIKDKKLLPEVVEDGKTASENARKKSIAYAKALERTVFSMDNALYLEGLPAEKQPGLNVRRINGSSERPTDEQMLEYYSKLIGELGGRTNGYWEFAICIANPQGEYEETVIKSPRIFVSKPSETMVEGYPLESIQIEPKSERYISEMSQNEQDLFWQNAIGKPLLEFVQKVDI